MSAMKPRKWAISGPFARKSKAPVPELADQDMARLCVSLSRDKATQVLELERLHRLADSREQT